jgi:hypothetical protein
MTDAISGLGALFGMSPELAGFLAACAIAFDGDPLTSSWSIGGPPRSSAFECARYLLVPQQV